MNRDDYDFIHLYEAEFTSEFLRMLDKPMNATSRTNIPDISRRKIPFKPFEDFPERIRAEIFATNLSPSTSDVLDSAHSVVNEGVKRPFEQEDDEGRYVRHKS